MLEQQEMEFLFVHAVMNNKTQSPFPLHRVGFRLVPQEFNLHNWISILSLFLLESAEIKVKSMPQLYWNEETFQI